MADVRAKRPNILLITTDQQRYDSLGCNGNTVCRTPSIDSLAAAGIRYERAHVQNVLCMPSRATIVTGQYPGTHGVWNNGVCLPRESPSVAHVLKDAGYATSHIGKMHFETTRPVFSEHLRGVGERPVMTTQFVDIDGEQIMWIVPTGEDLHGPHRGFDFIEHCNHFVSGHHALWVRDQIGPKEMNRVLVETMRAFRDGFGGDTGALQSVYSMLPAELHASTWVVDRTIAWLDEIGSETPFFSWVSFDDPHHPFNPPAGYGRRYDWREMTLPNARRATREAIAAELAGKPWQYGAYWRGEYGSHEGSLGGFTPMDLTDDQVREMIALTYGMVELIDDNIERLLAHLVARGLDADTHVFFTTDHGELLGDHGLILKGPFHLDGLVRAPLIWRDPHSIRGVVTDPVGLLDLAPTFCSVAGVPIPGWMDGAVLPVADGTRERVLTQYDSQVTPELVLRSMYRDGWFVTAYPKMGGVGELYDMREDPHQVVNRWEDPARRALRDELVRDLAEHVVEDPRAERLRWWAIA
ncbi:MAG: sulfatase-like hydrolase/transferase [Actinomycetota bacterium]